MSSRKVKRIGEFFERGENNTRTLSLEEARGYQKAKSKRDNPGEVSYGGLFSAHNEHAGAHKEGERYDH